MVLDKYVPHAQYVLVNFGTYLYSKVAEKENKYASHKIQVLFYVYLQEWHNNQMIQNLQCTFTNYTIYTLEHIVDNTILAMCQHLQD